MPSQSLPPVVVSGPSLSSSQSPSGRSTTQLRVALFKCGCASDHSSFAAVAALSGSIPKDVVFVTYL